MARLAALRRRICVRGQCGAVFAYLVLTPSGPILIDTGVGLGNPLIDELYSPVHHDLDDALSAHGVTVAQVNTVITSHLHFDHCGQNDRFTNAISTGRDEKPGSVPSFLRVSMFRSVCALRRGLKLESSRCHLHLQLKPPAW